MLKDENLFSDKWKDIAIWIAIALIFMKLGLIFPIIITPQTI